MLKEIYGSTNYDTSPWDRLTPELRDIIEDAIGHPIIAWENWISWNQDYVYPGSKLHRELMYNPPKYLDIDKRIYRDNIERVKTVKGKTFLFQLAQNLGRHFAESTTGETITETDGTTTTTISATANMAWWFGLANGASSSTYGLTVGSSSTAVTRTDTQLGTKITHGAAAGNLQYGANSASTASNPSGTINRVQVSRTFTGNAGSTASINEDGLEAVFSSTNVYCLMYRNINSFGAVSAAQVVTGTVNVDVTS